MENLLSKSYLLFIEKHKSTFLIVVLVLAIAYQYVDRAKMETKYYEENKRLNDKYIELTFKTLEYERQRSEKFEFLLNNLSKNPPTNVGK